MPRIVLAALAALLMLLPATADGHSGLRLRGTVTAVHPANNLLNVRSGRLAHVLRAPGSLARIRVGMRVELRGTTLRRHGNGSRVLARGVVIVSSVVLASHVRAPDPDLRELEHEDDEEDEEDEDDRSGPGDGDDDDDDDRSGSGDGDDDDDDDNSGPGGGDDDDDEDD